MPLHSAARAFGRLILGAAIVVAALPLGAGDAEARRRVRARAVIVPVPSATRHHVVEQERVAQPDSEAHEDATGNEDTGNDGAATPRALSVAPVKGPPKDIEVPGCAPGMFCTVCVAGCIDPANAIVHVTPKSSP